MMNKRFLAMVLVAALVSTTPAYTVCAEELIVDEEETIEYEEEIEEYAEEEIELLSLEAPVERDSDAPVVSNISVNKTEFNVGDTIVITANIDDASDIREANVLFSAFESTQNFAMPFYHVSGNVYEASYTVPESATSGMWALTYVKAVDVENNKFGTTTNNEIVITVVKAVEEDHTAPTLAGVSVSSDSLTYNDTQYVKVECHDSDLAKITFTVGAFDGGKTTTINYNVTVNESGIYEVPVAFTPDNIQGRWIATNFRLYDTNSNVVSTCDMAQWTLTGAAEVVDNSDKDLTAPTITRVAAPKSYEFETVPATFNVTVIGTEDKSSSVKINVCVSNPNVEQNIYAEYTTNVTAGKFFATVPVEIKENIQNGNWVISWVKITDESDNYVENYSQPCKIQLTQKVSAESTENITDPAKAEQAKINQVMGWLGDSLPAGSTIVVNAGSTIVEYEKTNGGLKEHDDVELDNVIDMVTDMAETGNDPSAVADAYISKIMAAVESVNSVQTMSLETEEVASTPIVESSVEVIDEGTVKIIDTPVEVAAVNTREVRSNNVSAPLFANTLSDTTPVAEEAIEFPTLVSATSTSDVVAALASVLPDTKLASVSFDTLEAQNTVIIAALESVAATLQVAVEKVFEIFTLLANLFA